MPNMKEYIPEHLNAMYNIYISPSPVFFCLAAESLQPLIKWLFHEPNPIPVNTALAMLGLAKPVFRMPYVPTSKEQRAEGAKLMAPLLGSIPGNKGVKVMEDSEFILVKRYC